MKRAAANNWRPPTLQTAGSSAYDIRTAPILHPSFLAHSIPAPVSACAASSAAKSPTRAICLDLTPFDALGDLVVRTPTHARKTDKNPSRHSPKESPGRLQGHKAKARGAARGRSKAKLPSCCTLAPCARTPRACAHPTPTNPALTDDKSSHDPFNAYAPPCGRASRTMRQVEEHLVRDVELD